MALLGAVLAFYLGASHVLELRIGTGEVYPRFSTYRSDPQGFRALYEALNRLPGVEALRNRNQLAYLPLDETGLLLISDAVSSPDPVSVIERIETFVKQGGRLVIAYAPLLAGARSNAFDEEPPREASTNCTDEPQDAEDCEEPVAAEPPTGAQEDEDTRLREYALMNLVDVEERWGVELDVLPLDAEYGVAREYFEQAREATPEFVFAEAEAMPKALPWRSARFFREDDEHWTVWYRYESGEAAIIARDFGAGTIVMLGDSYLLSNESLATDPIAPFLARLIGPHTRVIFDEWTKGLQDDPWLIDLIRRYRLDGVLAALATLALLVAWRSAMPLPPRPTQARSDQDTAYLQTRHSAIGLPALIERHISSNALPQVCFDEWDQSFRQDRRYDAQFREELRHLLCHEGPETPLERYRAASALIEERKHYRD